MRTFVRAALAALVAVPVGAIAGDSFELAEGRWKQTITPTGISMGGTAMPMDAMDIGADTEFVCIGPEEAREPALYFLKSQGADCSTPQGSATGGRVAMTAECRNDDTGPMKLAIDGSYRRDSFSAKARAETSMLGAPMVVDMRIDGEFVGACTGDEKK